MGLRACNNELPLPKSNQIKFSVLSWRSEYLPACLRCIDSILSNSSVEGGLYLHSIGLTKDGFTIPAASLRFAESGNSVLVEFDEAVEWDGWYFQTSMKVCPLHDPVRFALESRDNGEWKTVGSSSHVRLLGGVVFLHGHYSTSTQRGAAEHFSPFRGHKLLDLINNLLGGGCWLLLGLTGVCRAEHLSTIIYCAHSLCRIVVCLQLAALSAAAGQPAAAGLQAGFGLIHLCVLLLVGQERWLASLAVTALGVFLIGAAMRPHPYHGAQSPGATLLSVGGSLLVVTTAVAFFRRRTAALALSLVARDRRAYDALWAGMAAGGFFSSFRPGLESILRGECETGC